MTAALSPQAREDALDAMAAEELDVLVVGGGVVGTGTALDAVSRGLSTGLLEQRDRGQWFRDQADVQARLQRQEALEGQTLSVRSEWFLLSGELRLDHSRVATQALINRAADRSRIVWIR